MDSSESQQPDPPQDHQRSDNYFPELPASPAQQAQLDRSSSNSKSSETEVAATPGNGRRHSSSGGAQATPRKVRLADIQTTIPDPSHLPPNDASSVETAGTQSMANGPFSGWSASSDRQLGHASNVSETSDRVFPIRSVVSVDPTAQTPNSEWYGSAGFDDRGRIPVHRPSNPREPPSDLIRRMESGGTISSSDRAVSRRKSMMKGPYSSIQADAARQGSIAPLPLDISAQSEDGSDQASQGDEPPFRAHAARTSLSQASGSRFLEDPSLVTTRFTHVETEGGHSVITGRDGVLQRCEDEPIHTPGAVQGFGVLVAVREDEDGRFVVHYVSENAEKILGFSPRELFRLKNFLDILTEEQQDNLLDHIDFIRDEDADPAVNGPEVFSISIRPPTKRSLKLWCAIHISPAHPDLIICEFELDDDVEHPLRPGDEMTPDSPHDTLQSNPTLEEIEQSTEILSKPLRILRSARKRRGEQGAMQVFDIMSQVQEQLATAPNLDDFLKILVGIVKELTGFHRVMIYQFDSSHNGKVVTELVDTAQTRDLYMGLNFPASDIPRQARELYKLNKVRLLYDRDLETARIVCRTKEDLEVPLDMSHAYLRAMSPIHLKYLANMAVRSSMSISINAFTELWGLIACHSYGSQGMRVSFPIRKMCRLVGDTASRNIERLSYASRLQARKLINTAPTDKNPSGYIIASSDDLLRLFDADSGLLSIKGETKIMGMLEQSQEALALLEYLRMRQLTSVVASQDLKEDFPDLRYPPGFQFIAGLMYVPLSVGGSDFIVFLRKGQVKEVKWAGNPYEKIIRDGTAGYLEPRTSFKTWHETVVGKCREWNDEQVETAAVLCLVYGKFIEVWRQKEAALQRSKLTRLLLANSAHEVRTPLNAIINYLEIALEGSLDQETRDNLAKSHSASKSLIYVINDLLDLTKTEEGGNLIKDEVFDLPLCIQDATEPFMADAKRKGLEYSITQHPGLPRLVHGDTRRIRQAISNLVANAIAYTNNGFVRLQAHVSDVKDQKATVDFVVEDSGCGMSGSQLDALFRDLEQVSYEESADQPESADSMEKPHNTRALGLGLAMVARIVRNMQGQLRLKSDEGEGSRFVVQLPFSLPADVPSPGADGDESAAALPHPKPNTVSSAPAAITAAPEGEILLVDRQSATLSLEDEHKHTSERSSLGSRKSGRSLQSAAGSNRSDADRLIDAIQTPLSLGDRNPDYFPRLESKSATKVSNRPLSGGSWGGQPKSPVRVAKEMSSIDKRPEPGTADVRDSKTPVRAVKVPDDYYDMPAPPGDEVEQGALYEIKTKTEVAAEGKAKETNHTVKVLIAEDDPINMKILRKRLEKQGHTSMPTVNGEDCATYFGKNSQDVDVVLMDMQMPIVDGLTSTKMIRQMEKESSHQGHSELAIANRRVPIFAVSASLVERDIDMYIDAGFDGWILKPIDFKRLQTLFKGIFDEEVRNDCLYTPASWEQGGWFCSRAETKSGDEDVTPKAEESLNPE